MAADYCRISAVRSLTRKSATHWSKQHLDHNCWHAISGTQDGKLNEDEYGLISQLIVPDLIFPVRLSCPDPGRKTGCRRRHGTCPYARV